MDLPTVMLVTDRTRTRGRELVELVAAAARGGVRLVQVREKDLPDDELRDLLARIRDRVPPSTLLIVNGSARVARTARVGLHLPAADPLPPRKGIVLMGRSVHDAAEARQAAGEGMDYLVAGPVYPTASKPGHPGAGPALIAEIASLVAPIPLFAIGGMQVSRIPEVLRAGAHGVAACGAILEAPDPRRVAEAFALAVAVTSPPPGEQTRLREGGGRSRGPQA